MGVVNLQQAPDSQDASQALALWGGRSAGRAADPKAIEDALWSLMLGYLDARLPGGQSSAQFPAPPAHGSDARNTLSHQPSCLIGCLIGMLLVYLGYFHPVDLNWSIPVACHPRYAALHWLAPNFRSVYAGSTKEDAAGAAANAVDMCLGLERRTLLWEDVVPRFQQTHALGALLDCLLPRIMAGQLQSLAPEVMQVLPTSFLKLLRAPHSPPTTTQMLEILV